MFCHKCGSETPDDSQFCRKCGYSFAGISTGGGTAAVPAPAPRKVNSYTGVKLLILVLMLGALWWILSQAGKPADVIKTVVHLPIDLTNAVENVHAHSWWAVPIQVPYDGSLTITAQVQRGNAIQMYLTNAAGLETLKTDGQNTYLGGFLAPEARTFQHTERIIQGTYYFVLRDNSLGILSANSSDVAVKARIEP